MTGRESKENNDVFFVCSLIEYIARKTLNHRNVVANALGLKNIQKLLELADVYHSDNIDSVSDSFINECKIKNGNFDNVAMAEYAIPTHWDIGKVYKRLALGIAKEKQKPLADSILEAFSSFASEKIENFNSSFYYDNPNYILACHFAGKILEG